MNSRPLFRLKSRVLLFLGTMGSISARTEDTISVRNFMAIQGQAKPEEKV